LKKNNNLKSYSVFFADNLAENKKGRVLFDPALSFLYSIYLGFLRLSKPVLLFLPDLLSGEYSASENVLRSFLPERLPVVSDNKVFLSMMIYS